jgi:hypothetical protein
MALVMQKSVQIDEENQAREQELMSRLITENKVNKMFVCMFVLCKNITRIKFTTFYGCSISHTCSKQITEKSDQIQEKCEAIVSS